MFSMLKNITLKAKLMFLAIMLIGLIWVAVGVGVNKMQLIGSEISAIAHEDIPLTEAVTAITIHQLEQAIHFERAMRHGEGLGNVDGAESHFRKEVAAFDGLNIKIENELKEAEEIAKKVKRHAVDSKKVAEFQHVETLLAEINREHVDYEKHVHEIFSYIERDNMEKALMLSSTVDAEMELLDKQLNGLLLEIEKFTEDAVLLAEQDEATALKVLLILGVIATVFAFSVSIPIINSITKGVQKAVHAAKTIADGDLSQKITVDSKDEIGKLLFSLEEMRTNLHNMVSELTSSSTQLAATAEELAVVTGETNKNISVQTSEIDQVVTAINEMSATVHEVATNAANTSQAAQEANISTVDGQQVVEMTVESIGHLATEIDNTSDVVNQLEADSEAISGVLDVIKNIAEQTNLLALNAAIEAARAGEQGRGFAVVADEVRTLASRTQESTLEIEEMIDKLQQGSQNAVSAMTLSKNNATESVDHANKAGMALAMITSSVSNISDMSTQIASAAEEQAIVTEEINRNISTVNEIMARTADGANETTAASEELAQLAANMNNLALRFVV